MGGLRLRTKLRMYLKTKGLLTIQLGMLAKIVGKFCRLEVGIASFEFPIHPKANEHQVVGVVYEGRMPHAAKMFRRPWEGSGEVEDFLVRRESYMVCRSPSIQMSLNGLGFTEAITFRWLPCRLDPFLRAPIIRLVCRLR